MKQTRGRLYDWPGNGTIMIGDQWDCRENIPFGNSPPVFKHHPFKHRPPTSKKILVARRAVPLFNIGYTQKYRRHDNMLHPGSLRDLSSTPWCAGS
jgi:hypothetical protein